MANIRGQKRSGVETENSMSNRLFNWFRRKPAAPAVIQLKLHELTQLFNSMDPSPFADKDLDSDAEAFIEGWAMEFPPRQPLTLVVHLDQAPETAEADPRRFVEAAIQNFFLNKTRDTRRELRDLMRNGQVSLLTGIAFLVTCLTASKAAGKVWPETSFAEWIAEGLIIAGWVAMWHPLEIYLYGWVPIWRRLRIYRKMSRLRVQLKIRHAEVPPGPAAGAPKPAPAAGP